MKLWNTLSGQKEEFRPQGDPVLMYVCGVTPYDESHIGHAMSYIVFDVIRRYLEFKGYNVRYVQNFTDIDDKLINRARQAGIPVLDLADRFIGRYFDDMDALNVRRAEVYPRVSQEIPGIIDLISKLEQRGYAYPTGGDVYFRVQRDEDYGKLSHRTLEGMQAGARVEVGELKEDPMDFVLWKGAKPGEPQWESPWGPGRPGWHIECSAMAMRYLGPKLDIHGGGHDLIFPHHENEIAQSECATGEAPFARYWLHNGLLRLGEEKMSKSLGNLVTIDQVLTSHSADALRLFVLSSHYRGPLTYNDEALDAADKGADRLREALRPADRPAGVERLDPASQRQRFIDAMDDDFNSAQAVAALFDLARDINRARERALYLTAAQDTLRELAGVLGMTLDPQVRRQLGGVQPAARGSLSRNGAGDAEPFIDLLIELRSNLRVKKEFALADAIRVGLTERGVTLEDSAAGTTWKRK
ncbi:MAG: cysteine--tRNA ligase [Dehalococcoidia bacterium]|nr:cysteine--tRNA ligase [Dehalococcoidia bacterium]